MYNLHGDITIAADGSATLVVSVYSEDMQTEYGLMCVSNGELVKVIGKKKTLTEKVWPMVKQAFNL